MDGTAERNGAIEVGGRRLGWRSLGSGPPLLLVNGYAWPGSQLERFAGGGHGFMAQEPRRPADLIASFLRR